jgi:vacuolar-type H+-ATPase subunit H
VSEQGSFQQLSGLSSSQLNAASDGDMMAFINSLIEQNAELTQKLRQLASQAALADEIVAKAQQKAESIRQLAEKEANNRAASIIQELEKKAKAEADSILTKSIKQAEDIKSLKEKEASARAAAIISESEAKAKLEADRILAEARRQAQVIAEEENKKAQQYGLLIIDKAREKAISILNEANAQVSEITSKSSQKLKR